MRFSEEPVSPSSVHRIPGARRAESRVARRYAEVATDGKCPEAEKAGSGVEYQRRQERYGEF